MRITTNKQRPLLLKSTFNRPTEQMFNKVCDCHHISCESVYTVEKNWNLAAARYKLDRKHEVPWNRGVKLAPRGPNPARHDLFCGRRHVSFVLALGLTELRLLLCHIVELRSLFKVVTRQYDL